MWILQTRHINNHDLGSIPFQMPKLQEHTFSYKYKFRYNWTQSRIKCERSSLVHKAESNQLSCLPLHCLLSQPVFLHTLDVVVLDDDVGWKFSHCASELLKFFRPRSLPSRWSTLAKGQLGPSHDDDHHLFLVTNWVRLVNRHNLRKIHKQGFLKLDQLRFLLLLLPS